MKNCVQLMPHWVDLILQVKPRHLVFQKILLQEKEKVKKRSGRKRREGREREKTLTLHCPPPFELLLF